MKTRFTRRQALGLAAKSATAAAAFTIVPRHVLGGPGQRPPSEELTKAVIGVGGMGQGHVRNLPGRTLAVCDVDSQHLAAGLRLAGPDAKAYHDFREVLERDDIDIIHVATPPHWHAAMAIAAAQAGKDVWCEKPMTRTIYEGEKVVEAVQRYGRIFRLNTWFRFQSNFYGFGSTVKPIKKIVQSGMLGWPLKVRVNRDTGFDIRHGWTGRPNLQPEQVPQQLDYDFWLGPAPIKPYNAHRVHGSFRGYWDYDGGRLGDMGQHFLDPVQYILDKDDESPVEIECDTPQQHPDAVLEWRWIRMRYADGCEILLGGDDGSRVPFLEGPEGKLYPNLESDIPDMKRLAASLPDPEPQAMDFHECVRARRTFALNEANGHRSCTLVNLAKIAIQLGRPLRFDPKTQRFPDDEEANRLVRQPMRAPWIV